MTGPSFFTLQTPSTAGNFLSDARPIKYQASLKFITRCSVLFCLRCQSDGLDHGRNLSRIAFMLPTPTPKFSSRKRGGTATNQP